MLLPFADLGVAEHPYALPPIVGRAHAGQTPVLALELDEVLNFNVRTGVPWL